MIRHETDEIPLNLWGQLPLKENIIKEVLKSLHKGGLLEYISNHSKFLNWINYFTPVGKQKPSCDNKLMAFKFKIIAHIISNTFSHRLLTTVWK